MCQCNCESLSDNQWQAPTVRPSETFNINTLTQSVDLLTQQTWAYFTICNLYTDQAAVVCSLLSRAQTREESVMAAVSMYRAQGKHGGHLRV